MKVNKLPSKQSEMTFGKYLKEKKYLFTFANAAVCLQILTVN